MGKEVPCLYPISWCPGDPTVSLPCTPHFLLRYPGIDAIIPSFVPLSSHGMTHRGYFAGWGGSCVKRHRKKILEKLKVGNRNQLIDNHRDTPCSDYYYCRQLCTPGLHSQPLHPYPGSCSSLQNSRPQFPQILLSWVSCWREMSSHSYLGGPRATVAVTGIGGIPLSGQKVAVWTEGASGSRVRHPPPLWISGGGATWSQHWLVSST